MKTITLQSLRHEYGDLPFTFKQVFIDFSIKGEQRKEAARLVGALQGNRIDGRYLTCIGTESKTANLLWKFI